MWMYSESFTEEYEELENLKNELNEEQWAGYDEWLDTLPADLMPSPEEEE